MKTKASIIFSLVLALFLFGIIFPEEMWGIHGISFMPFWLQFGLIALGVGSIAFFSFSRSGSESGKLSAWGLIPISILVGVCSHQFPIVLDSFGDANALIEELNIRVTDWTPRFISELIKPNLFNPKTGEETLYALTAIGSYFFGISAIEFLFILETICAILFTLSIGSIIWLTVRSASWRMGLLAVCISAPFMLVFQAHLEVYALSTTASTAFLALVVHHFHDPRKWKLILIAVTFPVTIKFHILHWLLFPVVVHSAVVMLPQDHAFRNMFSSTVVLRALIPSGIILTIITYLLVVGGIHGTREYSENDLYSSLLLPIIASEGPPYNRYGLLHWAHFRDMFNQILFWSPPALGLIILGRSFLKDRSVNSPIFSLLLSLIAMLLGLFILNPLLSIPMDADLFSVPAPIFLTLAIIIAGRLEFNKELSRIPVVLVTMSLISLSSGISVANPEMLSQRYETLGRYVFKTHWMGSSTEIENAMKLEQGVENALARQLAIVEDLHPYSTAGKDTEYAELLRKIGLHYQDILNDPETALTYFNWAFDMNPVLRKNIFNLVVTNFQLEKYQAAQIHVRTLVKMRYPSQNKALRMGIHVALASNNENLARQYVSEYLKHFPDDRVIIEVAELIKTGQISEALQLFSSS